MSFYSRALVALSVGILLGNFVSHRGVVSAQQSTQEACDADIDQTGPISGTSYAGTVNLSDYTILVRDFLKSTLANPRSNINKDSQNQVNLSDYAIFTRWFLKPVTCPVPGTTNATPQPTLPSNQTTSEWTQFGHDAQHTSYTSQTVPTPWKYAWQWNGADANGKTQPGSHLSVPKMVQPITGGGRVYMVAGGKLTALSQQNGSQLWQQSSIGTLSTTPIYVNESLFIGSENGTVYRLNAANNGQQTGSFTTSGPIKVAPTIVGSTIIVGNSNGMVYAIDASTMTKKWEYSAGSPIVSPASYSQNKNLVIVNSQDLNVHAINFGDGTRKWKAKPTNRTYSATIGEHDHTLAQFEEGWPVIAEQHGIVFVRYRLDWDSLWAANPYPDTNAAIRSLLSADLGRQALFALSLDTGNPAFVPAVGNGGQGDGGVLPMGPQPVIRIVDGKEVAYIIWRNGLTCNGTWCDGREDATMGEMVLDTSTVSGYQAGDIRFVKFIDIQTDEMMYLTMSGDTIFHNHWLASEAEKIIDRNSSLGATFANPIKTQSAPYTIWRQIWCNSTVTTQYPLGPNCNPQIFPGGNGYSSGPSNCPFNATTRYCAGGLYSYGDQRGYPAGFYEYHNDHNAGSIPFTIISGNTVLVKTIDGALMAYVNGNPTGNIPQLQPLVQAPAAATNVLGITTPTMIEPREAIHHVGEYVSAIGEIKSVVNHMPKAMYLGFSNPHDGNLLVRVFSKDANKFDYDLTTLLHKKIKVTGTVSLYWPEMKDAEIVVTDPSQIEVVPENY